MTLDANDILRERGPEGLRRAWDGARIRGDADQHQVIRATKWRWRDPTTIPRRRFIYGGHYTRGHLSADIAPPGVGKSSLKVVEALSMITGRPLLGIAPTELVRVWLYNLEDPADETERRVAAACLHYGIAPEEIQDRLFIDSGREQELILAEQTRNGTLISVPVVDALVDTIKSNRIDVVIIDPFVSSHRVTENDNNAIDAVAKTWCAIADETNAAVDLVHHSRKTNGSEITIEDGRGAGALIAASRSARTLNTMSETDAARAGDAVDNRRLFFRVDNGKANLLPPPDACAWHRLVSVPLGNGDAVAVVTAWDYPNPFDGLTTNDLRRVQLAFAGKRYRKDVQANDWAGKVVAETLGLDLEKPSDKDRTKRLLKTWIENGAFRIVSAPDGKGNERPFLEVGEWAS